MDFSKLYRPHAKPELVVSIPEQPKADVPPACSAAPPDVAVAPTIPDKQAGLFVKPYPPLIDAPVRPLPARPMPAQPAPAKIEPVKAATAPAAAIPASPESSLRLFYQELIKLANELVLASNSLTPMDPALLRRFIAHLIARIKTEPNLLLALPLESESPGMLAHMVHLTILSIFLGLEIGASDAELEILGLTALFHDIAMPRFHHIVNVSRQLTPQEADEVREHVRMGMAITERLLAADPQLAHNINHCAQFVHERVNGSGYPAGLKGSQIPVGSQIIGLADMYDALTHKRSWRESSLSAPAVIYFVRQCGVLFDANLVKSFLNAFTLFPPGSHVELSTGERAQVVAINRGLLTRPRVRLAASADGAPGAIVDLRENQAIHIVRQIGCAPGKVPNSAGRPAVVA